MSLPICLMFFLFLAALHSTQSQTDLQMLQLQCLSNLEQRMSPYLIDFENAFETLPDGRERFCNEVRNDLTYRIDQIGNFLKDCLDQETAYLGDFVKESVKESLHFWCHNQGENMMKYFSPESSKCRQYIEYNRAKFQVCYSNPLQLFLSLLSKSELCSRITDMKKCYNSKVNTYCPEDYSFQKVSEELTNYMSKPCSGCANTVNVVILLSLLVFHWLLNQ